MAEADVRRRAASPWLTKLDDAPDALELPMDRPRPPKLSGAVEEIRATVDPGTFARLEGLAASVGSGPDAALLALWQIVLARHVDEWDLVIGCTPPSGSATARDAWLVVRSTIDLSGPFHQVVKSAAEAWAEAAQLPVTMAELLSALRVEPGPGKHPIFQVALAAGPGPADAAAGGAAGTAVPCDLTLVWEPSDDGLELAVRYPPELFDRRRVERILARTVVLLQGVVADADRPVAEIPLLGEDELERLRSWNETAHPHDGTRTIAALFAEQVERTPDSVAVEFGGQSLTYRQLDQRANQLAHLLIERGVAADDTVAITMERSIAMVVAVLAVLKAGGAYVPIDPTYPPARRTYMVEHARARLVLVAESWHAGSEAPGDEVEVLDAGDTAAHLIADRPVTAPPSSATGEHLGYVIFTSGSTGQPKGVALPQRALTNLIEWQLRRPDFEPGVRTLQFASLSFDVSFQEIFSTWCSGGTLVLIRDQARRDPRGLLDHLHSHRVGRVFLPFVALRGLADAAGATGRWPTTLREVYTAGEQLVIDDTVRRFFTKLPRCLLENQYGPSETHVATAHRLHGDPATWPTLPPVGRPIDNATAVVLDPHGHLSPLGVPGELFLGGANLAREYLGRPDLTTERFVERPEAAPGERLYRTGDLARWTEHGELEFLGRIDHQVKFRGFRIEPGEVASVLSALPEVRQCVASVVDIDGVGPRLAAYFVPRDGAQLSLQELHAYARDRLPDYMVPSHYVVLDSLPLTPSGKIDTAGLPAPTFDRGILSTPYEAPATPVEEQLAQIWQSLLGVDRVGRNDDFFELGGDSLMAVEMFLQIGERFDDELPLGALAQFPTVAGLARLLKGDAEGDAWQPLVPLQEAGDKTPLFCVHGGSGNIASFPNLARALPPDQPVYALQWDGLHGRGGARTIEAMAERYLDDVRAVQPHGPYLLAGQCVGGLIARDMARQLLDAGEDVGLLVMYESPNVTTRHFRLKPEWPPLPRPISPILRRLLGVALTMRQLLNRKHRPDQVVRIRLRDLLHRPIPPEDRTLHSTLVMVRAVWRHRPRRLPVRTFYVNTGAEKAWSMALAGVWLDGLLGWSDEVSDQFRPVRVQAEHNDVPFAPEAIALVDTELERFHAAAGHAARHHGRGSEAHVDDTAGGMNR